ncbi:vacuolar protein [Moniliophthora roreri MCA 2997]|uniref:Vacuolar protein n=1 Tax=Moniliophthora roreri (strain MCA 2997) TaxID=1381753 RepID=V2YID8_MONRO|nr:vacuolar protein [Moniliophthora roreri MCA 2997]
MKLFTAIHVLSALSLTVRACGDDHDHPHGHIRKRFPPSAQLTPPSRPLQWGDINILHTTDTHGWLLGHQKTSFPEPNYSGDLGDFSSFVAHMKELAIEKDVDLLIVDSGDLHDGTGLSDGFPAGGVDAHDSNEFLRRIPYDVMAIGNHELYVYENALDMYQNFAPALKGRYLSSNVNITVVDQNNNTINVPVGERFAKFKTRKGRNITALGVLFDFTGNSKNTTVQKVADMVKEAWFADAIKDEPDVFLLVGHMPVNRDNWPIVFDAIRAVHPNTPILIFGGHTHIRDCVQLDGRSMSLESGRYMETIGWMSQFTIHSDRTKNITFSRRYLDPNRVTYEYHTGREGRSFDTKEGKAITQGLLDLSERFDLNLTYGTAPNDYTIFQVPYPSNTSLLSLFVEEASPAVLSINNTRASIPNLVIINSGLQRFDVYKGPFTKNDQLTASPFKDAFFYIPEVPLNVALQVLDALNKAGEARRRELEEDFYARGYVGTRFIEWLEDMDRRHNGAVRRVAQNLTLGYVTSDSCPGVGDDTLHAPLPFFSVPDFVASKIPDVADDAPIDLVFLDFIQNQLIGILNSVQSEKSFAVADVQTYSPVFTNEVLGVYAQAAWN